LESPRHRLHLAFADGGGGFHDFAQSFEPEGVANHIFKLALRESTRCELLAHELAVF
jgi:hypothetical protein